MRQPSASTRATLPRDAEDVSSEVIAFDALLPPQMAARAEQVGVKKANADTLATFVLATLAGAFIAFGALFATTVLAGEGLPYGVGRLLAGLVFSLGLILVVVGGAELFTGNTLIVMAWAGGRVGLRRLLRNWLVVYVGNFAGALGIALLVLASGQYTFGGGAVGAVALTTANAKVSLAFGQAIALGVLCNTLVCLAVWLAFSARSTADRILAIVPPIAAFVAAGFEHSVANMYFVPIGLLIRSFAPETFWSAIGRTAADYPRLTWSAFLLDNLLPVTIGNLIGGAVLVGAVYWFVYLRGRAAGCHSDTANTATHSIHAVDIDALDDAQLRRRLVGGELGDSLERRPANTITVRTVPRE